MRLLIGLLFATTLHAVVYINTGALQCGALTRSTNTVQTYCYAGSVVVYNAIHTVTNPGIVTMYQYTSSALSSIVWKFKLEDNGTVSYEVSTNNSKTLQSGVL